MDAAPPQPRGSRSRRRAARLSPLRVAAGLAVLTVCGTVLGFAVARESLSRTEERLDAASVRLAASQVEGALSRQLRAIQSLAALLRTGRHPTPESFRRMAQGTVGTEDLTPAYWLTVNERALEIEFQAMMPFGHRDAGGRLGDARVRQVLDRPGSPFGVRATVPTALAGTPGIYLVTPVLESRTHGHAAVAFIESERIAPPAVLGPRAEVLVDGRALQPATERVAAHPSRSFMLAGRRWTVAVPPSAASSLARALPWTILGTGLLISVLLLVVLGLVRQRERVTLELAGERAALALREAAAAAEERSRLARELHDSVSQALFSMTLQARTASLGLERAGIDPDGPVARPVRELTELTRGALAEIRALIFELRPQALGEEGLVSALRKHGAALASRAGLAIDVTGPDSRLDLPERVEEHLMRIALEAMHNAARHGQPGRIDVEVGVDGSGEDVLSLRVRDDGVGFDPAAAYPGHMGLMTMRDRARRIGGDLRIESVPGSGTAVTVTLAIDGDGPT